MNSVDSGARLDVVLVSEARVRALWRAHKTGHILQDFPVSRRGQQVCQLAAFLGIVPALGHSLTRAASRPIE
jgi:hypothetical protein